MSPCRGEATKEQRLSFDGHDEWVQMQNQGDDVATSEQDLELIKGRERAVRQLQAHTLDVRQRFKDLPVMIRDQGDPLIARKPTEKAQRCVQTEPRRSVSASCLRSEKKISQERLYSGACPVGYHCSLGT